MSSSRISLVALLSLAAVLVGGCGQEPAQQASQGASRPSLDVAELRSAVVAATGYDLQAVQVSASGAQVIVGIANSRLLASDHAARDAEATKIAAAVSALLASRGAGVVQAIHVNYAGEDGKIADAIDFRRSPEGRFVKDIT